MKSVLHYMLESVRVANESKEKLNLSEEELGQLFEVIDADQDQEISLQEVSALLSCSYPINNPER